jgi:signal transduction histidine kinase
MHRPHHTHDHHEHRHRFRHPHHVPPHWRGRRRLFFPFIFFFGGITLLFLTGVGLSIYLTVTQQTEIIRVRWLLLLCGIPFVFIFSAFVVGNMTFRRFGRPMTDIFSAIDAVAEGDLSVRVSEHDRRPLGLLSRRFNYMLAELERAETQRRNLTVDIAHELRTPLHIIQGNLEGMIDGVYEPSPENIKDTLDETRLLARLVNDLQTLSQAEAGQLPLHPARFLLADLLEDLTTSFSSQAALMKISLTSKIADPSQEIMADYDRLNQVLSNLVSNALRHTPEGGTVSLETETVPGRVRIVVHDNGSGIPEEDLPFIFDRFWRGDRARVRDGSHSGLGLAIARQLIQAHQGTIQVQSRPGEETKFTIELPVEAHPPT